MAILRIGSHGSDVITLQQQLNARLVPSPRLVPDGSFGPMTRTAVIRFQQANWLVADGDVGPATWNAVTGGETYTPILHRVPFIPQPTEQTCWAASTAMVTRSNVPAVIARTPADLILANGSIRNFSDTQDAVTGSARFARAHGMTVIPPMSWMPSALVSMLGRGPLIFDMLWNSRQYAAGNASPGHMITIVGIRGDGDQSGRGTTLRVHDPWEPNVGARYSVGYHQWIQEVPTRTYRVFHKV